MSDTQKMQADGGGKQAGEGKETDGQLASGGQSAGETYPNDAPSAEEGGFLGEGDTEAPVPTDVGKDTLTESQEIRDRTN